MLKNLRIIDVSASRIFSGDILIRDEKIEKIAAEIQPEGQVEVVECGGSFAVPGFVDAHSHIGMWEDSIDFEGADGNESSDPVTPHMRGIDGINPFDKCFEEAVAAGITTVMTGPGSANVVGGTFVAMKTAGATFDKRIIKNPAAMKIAFGENPKRVYSEQKRAPYTRMATAALLREILEKAVIYNRKKQAADFNSKRKTDFDSKLESTPQGFVPALEASLPEFDPKRKAMLSDSVSKLEAELPEYDPGLEAMRPEFDPELEVSLPEFDPKRKAMLSDFDPELEAMRLGFDPKREAMLPDFDPKLEALLPVIRGEIPLKAHAHRADDILTALRIAEEFKLDITIDHATDSVAIADILKEKNAKLILGPLLCDRCKPELRHLSAKNPSKLSEAGLKFALMTDHPVTPEQYLPLVAAVSVREGLDEFEALRSITLNAAEILGLEDRIGSLETGKDADIVVMDGHPLDIRSHVMSVYVSGKLEYAKG